MLAVRLKLRSGMRVLGLGDSHHKHDLVVGPYDVLVDSLRLGVDWTPPMVILLPQRMWILLTLP